MDLKGPATRVPAPTLHLPCHFAVGIEPTAGTIVMGISMGYTLYQWIYVS